MTQKCKTCGKEMPVGRRKYCSEHPSAQAELERTKSKERSDLGQCKSCSKPICADSKVFCVDHLIKNRERCLNDRQRRKKEGLCRLCNTPIAPDSTTWCEVHHMKHNAFSRNMAQKAREKELCVDCNSVPRMMRKRRCESCQTTYINNKALICRKRDCEEPTDLKYFCRKHGDEENEKLRNLRSEMKKKHICIYCFTEMSPTDPRYSNVLCESCGDKQKNQRKAVAA
jgi:hypothetical protein